MRHRGPDPTGCSWCRRSRTSCSARRRSGCSRFASGSSMGSAGSTLRVLSCPAGSRCCSASALMIGLQRRRPRPACDRSRPWSNCTARASPNSAATALALGRVVARRRGAVQVDVVDVGRLQAARAAARRASPCARPALPGCGERHVVGVAAIRPCRAAARRRRRGCRPRARAARRPPPRRSRCRRAPRRRAGRARARAAPAS